MMKKKILKSTVKSAQINTRVNHFEESDNQFYGGGGGGGGGRDLPPVSCSKILGEGGAPREIGYSHNLSPYWAIWGDYQPFPLHHFLK